MSSFKLVNGSCADQKVDAVVNAANRNLAAGGGIFGGSLADAPGESSKQCKRAYESFTKDYPDYDVDVLLCAFSSREMASAQAQI